MSDGDGNMIDQSELAQGCAASAAGCMVFVFMALGIVLLFGGCSVLLGM